MINMRITEAVFDALKEKTKDIPYTRYVRQVLQKSVLR